MSRDRSHRWNLATGVVVALSLGACGARSALDPPLAPGGGSGGDGGPGATDGQVPVGDGTVPGPDRGPVFDRGVPVRPDRGIVQPDLAPSCLPAPPAAINGAYVGGWKGVIDCQPLIGNTSFDGDLKLSIGITNNPTVFDVRGAMVGAVNGIGIKGDIEGKLSCTALQAKIPAISVQGGMIPLQLDGTLVGNLTVQANGRLNLEGDFEIRGQNFGNCNAKGSWFAIK